jgi:hypothetical protein
MGLFAFGAPCRTQWWEQSHDRFITGQRDQIRSMPLTQCFQASDDAPFFWARCGSGSEKM